MQVLASSLCCDNQLSIFNSPRGVIKKHISKEKVYLWRTSQPIDWPKFYLTHTIRSLDHVIWIKVFFVWSTYSSSVMAILTTIKLLDWGTTWRLTGFVRLPHTWLVVDTYSVKIFPFNINRRTWWYPTSMYLVLVLMWSWLVIGSASELSLKTVIVGVSASEPKGCWCVVSQRSRLFNVWCFCCSWQSHVLRFRGG